MDQDKLGQAVLPRPLLIPDVYTRIPAERLGPLQA